MAVSLIAKFHDTSPIAAPPRATRLDRRADFELAAGRHDVAERLSTLAAELRERFARECMA